MWLKTYWINQKIAWKQWSIYKKIWLCRYEEKSHRKCVAGHEHSWPLAKFGRYKSQATHCYMIPQQLMYTSILILQVIVCIWYTWKVQCFTISWSQYLIWVKSQPRGHSTDLTWIKGVRYGRIKCIHQYWHFKYINLCHIH